MYVYSTRDKLPEPGETVLAYLIDGAIMEVLHKGNGIFVDEDDDLTVLDVSDKVMAWESLGVDPDYGKPKKEEGSQGEYLK